MDEKYWPDPEAFLPERHITPDGKLAKETDHFLPFGQGIVTTCQLYSIHLNLLRLYQNYLR